EATSHAAHVTPFAARAGCRAVGDRGTVSLMGKETLAREVNEAKLEALIETMFLAAQSDGEFTAQERAHFVSSVQSLTEQRLEGSIARLVRRAPSSYRDNSRGARIQA